MTHELPLSLRHVTGYDCARALLLVGFRLRGASGKYALLERGDVALLLPQSREPMEPEGLLKVLDRASIGVGAFELLMARLGSRDTAPELPDTDAKRSA